MESLRRLRLMSVKLGLAAAVVSSAILYYFNPIAARGLLLGGVAGTLVFWIVAYRAEKLASADGDQLQFPGFSFRYALLRFSVYILALGRAYYIDPERYHAFIAAAIGLFIIRFVLVFLAFTEMDLKEEQK